MLLQKRAGERRFGALLAQDVILRGGEELTPFLVRMGDIIGPRGLRGGGCCLEHPGDDNGGGGAEEQGLAAMYYARFMQSRKKSQISFLRSAAAGFSERP